MPSKRTSTKLARRQTRKRRNEKLLEEFRELQDRMKRLTGSSPHVESIVRGPIAQVAGPSLEKSAPAPEAVSPTTNDEDSSAGKLCRAPSFERHRRKCAICHHAERASIEQDFIHWEHPSSIADDYGLEDYRVVYRHANATGLFDERRRNLRFALENLLERGYEIELTASAYIRACRAYASLNGAGEWVEPATRVIVTSGARAAAEKENTALSAVVVRDGDSGASNQLLPELEIGVSDSKQREDPDSNRQI